MATVFPTSHTSAQTGAQTKTDTQSMPKVPWAILFIGLIFLCALSGLHRWYQQTYSFNFGLDYFEPEFQLYWMNLLWAQLGFLALAGAIAIPVLWITREKNLDTIPPRVELGRYYWVLGSAAVGSILRLLALAVFTEADAAWHQVTIRDTDFTPTHIVLFYFWIPLLAIGLIIGFLWVHTRLPDFQNRVSIPLAILTAGPILIMPNLGLNEWGHTFFYAEELFAAPIHWGFVALAWSVFAMGGFILQCLNRIRVLTQLTHGHNSASVTH